VGPLMAAYEAVRNAAEHGGEASAALANLRQAEEEADLEYMITQVPRSLQAIAEGVRRIADIVGAMKSFSRDDWRDGAGVDLNEVLNNVLTITEHERSAVADLETVLTPLPHITGNGGELGQAFFNIVHNAVEAVAVRAAHHDGRGKIVIRTRQEGDDALVEIADTGCGIPIAIRGRIFEPFFTTKELGRGTGQGLAVAWSVIGNNVYRSSAASAARPSHVGKSLRRSRGPRGRHGRFFL
jgi:two-component system NtrC family sensor kinase